MKTARKRPKRQAELNPAEDVRDISTERTNPRSANLDTLSALDIARIINREDAIVPRAIARVLPKIAATIDAVAEAFQFGGRLIYVGTGTSGRLGALDASECPPTFNADPRMVQYVIAGGDRALSQAAEASEDSAALGRSDLARKRVGTNDVVVGLAASGRTPYTIAALQYAAEKGATTACITAVKGSPITKAAQIAIAIDVGPEVVAGSTRLKAGTMEKLVVNMITTGAFTRIGYVYNNLMVNVHLKNRKLMERGIGIVRTITGVDRERALELLEISEGSVPVALVMQMRGVGPRLARQCLKRADGNVRKAIEGS